MTVFGRPVTNTVDMTNYATTYFYDGTTVVGSVLHSSRTINPLQQLEVDNGDVYYDDGTSLKLVDTVVLEPADGCLLATHFSAEVMEADGVTTTLRLPIPDEGKPAITRTTAGPYLLTGTLTGWKLTVKTKPKLVVPVGGC